MARVLAYTSPARGDLYPVVPILDELRRRGHEIHVRTLAAEVERLSARGFAAQPIDERIEAIRHDDWKAKGARAALAAATAVFVARAPYDAADLRMAIDALDPDILILDLNPWGALAVAEGSGRPWAAVAPTRYRSAPRMPLRSVPDWLPPAGRSGGCAMPSCGR
jgi:UDP:flavonoid glycosyltransferase YjiC (YdhE family)